MKKITVILFVILFSMSAFTAHKFYVAIFQINYVPEKKMLQITSRIFVDDLNEAFKNQYNRKFTFENGNISAEDLALLQKYFIENLKINANNSPTQIHFLSLEMENNILICYFNIKNVSKLKSIEVKNEILLDYVTEQQNIIQTNIYGKKKNLLLTAENSVGKLNF